MKFKAKNLFKVLLFLVVAVTAIISLSIIKPIEKDNNSSDLQGAVYTRLTTNEIIYDNLRYAIDSGYDTRITQGVKYATVLGAVDKTVTEIVIPSSIYVTTTLNNGEILNNALLYVGKVGDNAFNTEVSNNAYPNLVAVQLGNVAVIGVSAFRNISRLTTFVHKDTSVITTRSPIMNNDMLIENQGISKCNNISMLRFYRAIDIADFGLRDNSSMILYLPTLGSFGFASFFNCGKGFYYGYASFEDCGQTNDYYYSIIDGAARINGCKPTAIIAGKITIPRTITHVVGTTSTTYPVTNIGQNAFAQNTAVKSLALQYGEGSDYSNLKVINGRAFVYGGLESVNFTGLNPDTSLAFGDAAFGYCPFVTVDLRTGL
ncbi:MAG: hypothetical protein EZS28_039425, partial [Streblomastix strix]